MSLSTWSISGLGVVGWETLADYKPEKFCHLISEIMLKHFFDFNSSAFVVIVLEISSVFSFGFSLWDYVLGLLNFNKITHSNRVLPKQILNLYSPKRDIFQGIKLFTRK